MNSNRFDAISRLFAERRISRRQALSRVGAGLGAAGIAATGLASASAQDATPEATTEQGERVISTLFLQSFQSGKIVPTEGADGRYTVTLEHGLGQTIYFSDRPERIVGTIATPAF